MKTSVALMVGRAQTPSCGGRNCSDRERRKRRLHCQEHGYPRVEAPRSRPAQHYNRESNAVKRFGQIEQIANPIGAIDGLPCVCALRGVEHDGTETDAKEPE